MSGIAAGPPTEAPAGAATAAIDVTRSSELFGNRRELIIEHAGFLYRLRITQSNKLILTK